MFTGIIQEIGQLRALNTEYLTVGARSVLEDVAMGDSISVDGTCLTVVRFGPDTFTVGVSAETLRRTTLGTKQPGARVNLEAALRAGGKLGGHFVSGHIDGVGRCVAITQGGASWEMDFQADAVVSRYIVPKGSIAINGVSLTVAECNSTGDWFRVAVIPHSFEQTTLADLRPGTTVNLEGDLLGKYVEKLLGLAPQAAPGVSLDFLAEHGYA
ncbi:MAG: riboflavin synthase [Gemmatimonadaceae bacterium]|nr:riboflavin synthase [Gloeobacterales cyanobacterium ES-bin-141]